MDLPNPPEEVTPRSIQPSNRKRRAEEDEKEEQDPLEASSKRLRFSGPYRPQNWSIPESIIYYILKNPSSTNVYQKLIRTCKYFFSKNPIIVCSDLNIVGRDTDNGRIYDLKIVQDGIPVIIDLKNLTTKLWVTKMICINSNNVQENFISSLIPRLHCCDFKFLVLWNQKLTFNEYIFLTSKPTNLRFKHITVTHKDGSIASLEELVEIAVKAKIFKLECSVTSPRISSATVKNLLQIQHFTSLDLFCLLNAPDVLDVDTLFAYVKKNKKTVFGFDFSPSISEACRKRVEKFVDEIIDAATHDFKPPGIKCDGRIDLEKYLKLMKVVLAYLPNL